MVGDDRREIASQLPPSLGERRSSKADCVGRIQIALDVSLKASGLADGMKDMGERRITGVNAQQSLIELDFNRGLRL